jgi:putative tricarboxylic transport membrane protein
MLACCVAIAWRATWRDRTRPFATASQLSSVGRVLGPAVGLVVAMQWTGLYVASALYIAVYMRWIGRHRWATVAALSLGVPVLTFLVFERWFLVPMPKGPLEAWLGH